LAISAGGESFLKYLREIFDDWLTRTAGIMLLLILLVVIFSFYSDLPEKSPLFGVLMYSLVPVLFIGGGVVFILAILRVSE